MSSRLELNTGVLKEKKQNYTSLTDINNIQLFTDDFEIVVEEEKRTAEKNDNNLVNYCFTGSVQEDEEDSVINNLFQGSQKIVVEENHQVVDYGNYSIFLGTILIGLIICILAFEITNRGEINKNDVDVDNRTE